MKNVFNFNKNIFTILIFFSSFLAYAAQQAKSDDMAKMSSDNASEIEVIFYDTQFKRCSTVDKFATTTKISDLLSKILLSKQITEFGVPVGASNLMTVKGVTNLKKINNLLQGTWHPNLSPLLGGNTTTIDQLPGAKYHKVYVTFDPATFARRVDFATVTAAAKAETPNDIWFGRFEQHQHPKSNKRRNLFPCENLNRSIWFGGTKITASQISLTTLMDLAREEWDLKKTDPIKLMPVTDLIWAETNPDDESDTQTMVFEQIEFNKGYLTSSDVHLNQKKHKFLIVDQKEEKALAAEHLQWEKETRDLEEYLASEQSFKDEEECKKSKIPLSSAVVACTMGKK